VEEVEAHEREVAVARERKVAVECEHTCQQQHAWVEAELLARWSASPETLQSGGGASPSRCIVITTSELKTRGQIINVGPS
jgi:hypothetical protein